ncbi:MAG: PD-(D/E)XK nuclease family protein [Nanoarchaeota archaeon]|nr:PD-(D/E)XK nuclease family protein [Nanoarchaeota archaeon]
MEQKDVKVYSHSRLSSFEQCRLKYKFQYIDKIIPEIEKTVEAHLGSIVHKTLEWLYSEVKEKRIPSMDEMIVYYSKSWIEEYSPELIENNGRDEKHYFNKGVQYLLDYYNRYRPFDDNTLEVEKEIFIDLDEKGEFKIRGFIDRLAYNLKTGEYEIHDYKTSNTMPKQEKIESDRQLALYSIAVKEMFGKDKGVRLIWHYLFFNKRIESKRTEEQLDRLKKETLELIRAIERTTEFPPNKSHLCNWCAYKPICPAWKNEDLIPKKPRWEKQEKLF